MFFTLYVFCMIPVFMWIFTNILRKYQDVSFGDMIGITVASMLPIFRELVVIRLLIGNYIKMDKVLFSQKADTNQRG
jgi:hypothetical protein